MSENFARCRALRHAWDPAGEVEVRGIKLVAFQCSYCATLRYDRWDTRTGQRWGNSSYSWPEGYRNPGHDQSWWRVRYVETLYASGVLSKPTTKRGKR